MTSLLLLSGILHSVSLSSDAQSSGTTSTVENKAIIICLSDASSWTDPKRKPNLIRCLESAGKNPIPSLLPVYMTHIDYRAIPPDAHPVHERDDIFPVLPAIRVLGLNAVPALVEYFKQNDPETDRAQDDSFHNCLLSLIDIYGDFRSAGAILARKRLESEIERSKGKEKERLEKVLRHPWLQRSEK